MLEGVGVDGSLGQCLVGCGVVAEIDYFKIQASGVCLLLDNFPRLGGRFGGADAQL